MNRKPDRHREGLSERARSWWHKDHFNGLTELEFLILTELSDDPMVVFAHDLAFRKINKWAGGRLDLKGGRDAKAKFNYTLSLRPGEIIPILNLLCDMRGGGNPGFVNLLLELPRIELQGAVLNPYLAKVYENVRAVLWQANRWIEREYKGENVQEEATRRKGEYLSRHPRIRRQIEYLGRFRHFHKKKNPAV